MLLLRLGNVFRVRLRRHLPGTSDYLEMASWGASIGLQSAGKMPDEREFSCRSYTRSLPNIAHIRSAGYHEHPTNDLLVSHDLYTPRFATLWTVVDEQDLTERIPHYRLDECVSGTSRTCLINHRDIRAIAVTCHRSNRTIEHHPQRADGLTIAGEGHEPIRSAPRAVVNQSR